MQLTALVLLAGAMGATAHPSHGHAHRDFHDKRDGTHYKAIHKTITKTITPPAATPTSTPAAVPTSSVPVAAAPTSAANSAPSSSSGSGSGSYVAFCGGASKREYVEVKRASDAQIAYTGNTGAPGNWGCNIMTVSSSVAHLYDYTSTYTNVASEPYQVNCFNKISADGGINGFDGGKAVSFTLAPGESQTIAIEANSQGACAFGPGSVPTDPYGAWAGAWVEFDCGNTSNNNWSGADCSSLVAQAAGLSVPGCQVCVAGGSTCSSILPGGQATNAYVKGMEAVDGTGINQPPGAFALNVKVGYSG